MAGIEGLHRSWLGAIDRLVDIAASDGALDRRSEAISKWSVSLQVEHLMRTDASVVSWLHATARNMVASDGPGQPNLTGRLVLLTGFIPRGKARAPDFTRPEALDGPALRDGLADVRQRAGGLSDVLDSLANEQATRRHPILGHFTPPRWFRFAVVHHRHHQKIIRDILESPE